MDVTERTLRIVPATENDVPVILRMIKGLAAYERLADRVSATEEQLRATLFGARPAAEVVIGYADETPGSLEEYARQDAAYLRRLLAEVAAAE